MVVLLGEVPKDRVEAPCALDVREEGRKVSTIIEEVFRVLILGAFGIHGSPGIVVRGTEEKIVGDGFVGHLAARAVGGWGLLQAV